VSIDLRELAVDARLLEAAARQPFRATAAPATRRTRRVPPRIEPGRQGLPQTLTCRDAQEGAGRST
jgi:hypothetical protein